MHSPDRTQYDYLRGIVMNTRTINRMRFSQIIGEHAVRMCDMVMAKARGDQYSRAMAKAEIAKLNIEWIDLVCFGERSDSEFCQQTTKLITAYSGTLRDYINAKIMSNDLDYLVQKMTKFFGALAIQKYRLKNMETQWIAYTGSILGLVAIIDKYGVDSFSFFDAAAHCIRSGVLLGQYMDHTLYNK